MFTKIKEVDNSIKQGASLFVDYLQDPSHYKQLLLWLLAITSYLLGADSYQMLIILLILILVDLITAITAAYKRGVSIKSSKLGRTIEKLIGYTALIIVAKLIGDVAQMQGFQKLIIAFYIAKEGYSIVENAKKIGIPVPALFQKAIEGEDIKN